jgi:hypothetical protein
MSNYEAACIDEMALAALESILLVVEDQLYFDSRRDDPKEFKIGIEDLTVDDLCELNNDEIFRIHSLIYGYKN